MNPQIFFGHFERLTDAPNAVARLRELVLQLAVQGKLVEQDERDEPAAHLLERIETDRKRLAKAKKIKEAKPLPLSLEKVPFELPSGWQIVRLGDIAEIIRGVSYKKEDATESPSEGCLPLLRANNINVTLNFEKLVYVPRELIVPQQLVHDGDVLIAMSSGSASLVGKAAQAESAFAGGFGAFCGLVRPTSLLLRQFFGLYFQTPFYREMVASFGKGIGINNLQKGHVEGLPFLVPPLEEQKRIVAKVDELMRLCDELERAQNERRESRQRLNRAALDRLLAAHDATEFQTRWQTIRDHFPLISAAPDQIGNLRQTILQLAVQGKLTRQDSQDEPAPALLRRIRAECERLLKKKHLKRADPLPPIDLKEAPFALPSGWMWVRLGDICHLLNGYAFKSSSYVPTSSNQLIRLGNVKNNEILLAQNPAYIPDEIAEENEGFLINENDVLLTMTGTKAKRDFLYTCLAVSEYLTGRRLFLNQRVAALRFGLPEISKVANIFLKAEPLLDLLFRDVTGTANQGNIGTSSIQLLPFPLPPLEEQKRIVAIVNRLMALCDELEAGLRREEDDGERLLRTVVFSLLAPTLENPAEMDVLLAQ